MSDHLAVRMIRRLIVVLAMTVGGFHNVVFGVTFDGIVVFGNVFEVRAGVSGRIESTRLAPGLHLSQGDELVRIDHDLYQVRFEDASNRLELMQAEYDEVKKAFERSEILFEEGSLSLVEFDHTQLLVQRAGVNLSQVRSEQLTARHHAELSRIHSPFDSVVLDVMAIPGQYVNAAIDAPLIATLAERGHFAVRIGIDAPERRGIELGDSARVIIDGGELRATVGSIRHDPAGAPVTWWLDVVFQSDAADIVPGLPARVELP